eukprot:jgi/Chlat1/3036/Chrsp206S03284
MLSISAIAARVQDAVTWTLFNFAFYPLYTSRAGLSLQNFAWRMYSSNNPAAKHTLITTNDTQRLRGCDVVPVPYFWDNYAYLIVDRETREAAAVDPADPTAITDVCNALGAKLTTVLTTHFHWDHAGGNYELATRLPGVTVIGGKGEGVAAATRELTTGDTLTIGANTRQALTQQHCAGLRLVLGIIETPCHTPHHVMFTVSSAPAPNNSIEAVFTGDTLFAGGAGIFFHGNALQMHDNLFNRMASIPNDAFVFSGHEVAQKNYRFACWMEPGNSVSAERRSWAEKLRSQLRYVGPTTMGEERRSNIFMRCNQLSVAKAVALKAQTARDAGAVAATSAAERVASMLADGQASLDLDIAVLDALRRLKDAGRLW